MRIIKGILLVIITLGFVRNAVAQDVIMKKDGSSIECKVTKLSSVYVEYKKWSNIDGPVYTIDKNLISSIKYENGEIEDFSPEVKDFMKREGRRLVLDGHILSDDEVLSLVGEENYRTYLSARNQLVYGDISAFVFAGSLLACIYFMFDGITNQDSFHYTLGIGAGILADIGFIGLIVNKAAGKGRLNWIADEYNKQHGSYKVSLAPSLMKFNTPQLSDTYSLGLTLSLKF